jgi:hypothetical protein
MRLYKKSRLLYVMTFFQVLPLMYSRNDAWGRFAAEVAYITKNTTRNRMVFLYVVPHLSVGRASIKL